MNGVSSEASEEYTGTGDGRDTTTVPVSKGQPQRRAYLLPERK